MASIKEHVVWELTAPTSVSFNSFKCSFSLLNVLTIRRQEIVSRVISPTWSSTCGQKKLHWKLSKPISNKNILIIKWRRYFLHFRGKYPTKILPLIVAKSLIPFLPSHFTEHRIFCKNLNPRIANKLMQVLAYYIRWSFSVKIAKKIPSKWPHFGELHRYVAWFA